jgi:glycine cleavage system H protein
MADDLTFLMGEFPARIPTDRRFSRNHMWLCDVGGRLRFGFTAYAVRLLQDVYFLEWTHEPQIEVREREIIGFIESSKAESDLYAPVSGRLLAYNPALLQDPSAINLDSYGEGWLFEMDADSAGTLSPAEYVDFLAAGWEQTQRLIKGQLND